MQNISSKQAKELMGQNSDLVILDVRTPQEFESGHIKSAVNMNIADQDFAEKIAELDKSKKYLVYC